ncbi:MAG: sel1 repeat family protein [Alphaproteobacteria bacterium]|nr:sel1 repeat family protein [Alphaproteobacteria bacterium]
MLHAGLALVLVLLSAPSLGQQAGVPPLKAPLHACDSLAGNPIDPGRVGPGVATAALRAEAAIQACQDAVRMFPDELRFQFQLARAFRQANRLEDALRWYTSAADRGYPGALNSLGVMYSLGEGVRADCNKAARYFSLAASHGYPAADTNLRTLACVRQV